MAETPESYFSTPHQQVSQLPHGFQVQNGRLVHQGIDLMSLVQHPVNSQGRIEMPTTPLYIRRLPALRSNYLALEGWFSAAKAETGYPGELTIAYASKANPSEPVARTLLQMGAAQECSSSFDVDLIRHATAAGWLDRDRPIFANGFKIPSYMNNLLRLRSEGFQHIVPILDDFDEITPLAESGMTFDVGLRQRTPSKRVNRFGMTASDLQVAAWRVQETNNLTLTTFHAMQTTSMKRGETYQEALAASLRLYARLVRIAPSLHCFNVGGGLPGRNSGMDFQAWMNDTLQTILSVCSQEDIPVPDLIVESGRYLVEDHACKLFSIVKRKHDPHSEPFYLIDGSIMSSFPDAWALNEEFSVLPLNHWDSPFVPARLAGLTCDRDDIYPTHGMEDISLHLPETADNLLVGFFDCGAYQETLGGRRGTKHCLLPEAAEMILDEDENGDLFTEYLPGQSAYDVLDNLGYRSDQIALPYVGLQAAGR